MGPYLRKRLYWLGKTDIQKWINAALQPTDWEMVNMTDSWDRNLHRLHTVGPPTGGNLSDLGQKDRVPCDLCDPPIHVTLHSINQTR